MLFIKELKKICFSFIYVLFIGLLLFMTVCSHPNTAIFSGRRCARRPRG